MTTYKVGQQRFVSIANLTTRAAEIELKAFDTNNDNRLDVREAKTYFEAKTGQQAPVDLQPQAVYALAGGSQRSADPYHFSLVDPTGAFAGNFQVPGMGAGNASFTREQTHGVPDVYRFSFNCDLIDQNKVEDIESANMVIGKALGNEIQTEPGSPLQESMTVPLDISTTDPYTRYGEQVPSQRVLQTGITTADLRNLAGGNDVAYYVELKMKDGTTRYINRDGQAYQNFKIPYYALYNDR